MSSKGESVDIDDAVESDHETDFHDSPVDRDRRDSRPDEEAFAVAAERPDDHETDFHDSPVDRGRRLSPDGGAVSARTPSTPGNHETDFHDSPRGGSRRREHVQIAGEEWAVENVVEVERLRRTYKDEYRALMVALGSPTRRGIVTALVQNSPRTYSELDEFTSKTTRTVKNHVSDLRDGGVVEVEDGRPATISFRNDEIQLLASDALSFNY